VKKYNANLTSVPARCSRPQYTTDQHCIWVRGQNIPMGIFWYGPFYIPRTYYTPLKIRHTYTVAQKTGTLRFVRLNFVNICNNTVTTDLTTPQVCRYTTLWNVSVLKATTDNERTSVITHLRVLRPAARRTHWTLYVKTAGCDSYFR